MNVFSFLLILISGIYFLFILAVRYGLKRIPLSPKKPGDPPPISVIIPARNEEKNLADCIGSLVAQTYPKHLMEAIIVDDGSIDSTASIAQTFVREFPWIKLVSLPNDPNRVTFKKYAVQKGIEASRNGILVTTDADCMMGPRWLEGLLSHLTPEVGVVTGWVLFSPDSLNRFFTRWQALEYLGLITSGVGLIGLDFPVICNAANFAYRKKAFDEVNGFETIDHLASGDDDLLMQKIHATGKWKVVFSPEKKQRCSPNRSPIGGRSSTSEPAGLPKGAHYPNPKTVALLLAIYFFYLLFFISWFGIGDPDFGFIPMAILVVKCLVEWPVMAWAFRLVGYRDLGRWYVPAQILQIPYIVLAGALGFFLDVTWKGRIQKNASVLSSPKIA